MEAVHPDDLGYKVVSNYLRAVGPLRTEAVLYRGHANRDWKLLPSAFRGQDGLLTDDHLLRWKAMAQRFGPITDDVHALVLAQHYGIPTPLLDWTANPLMALFFACDDVSSREAVGRVVQVPISAFHQMPHTWSVKLFDSERQQPALLDTSTMNVRSAAQDSFMSLHGSPSELALAPITVFEVQSPLKGFTLGALRSFGITPERVYADLGVAAAEMKKWLNRQPIVEALGAHGLYVVVS